jgi:hypothetical protein
MAPLLHNKWKWRLYTIVFVCKDNVNSCSDKINYGCFMHE